MQVDSSGCYQATCCCPIGTASIIHDLEANILSITVSVRGQCQNNASTVELRLGLFSDEDQSGSLLWEGLVRVSLPPSRCVLLCSLLTYVIADLFGLYPECARGYYNCVKLVRCHCNVPVRSLPEPQRRLLRLTSSRLYLCRSRCAAPLLLVSVTYPPVAM